MKKPSEQKSKEIIVMLILSSVYALAAFVSGNACAFAYSQPKEPENIHIYFERRSEKL